MEPEYLVEPLLYDKPAREQGAFRRLAIFHNDIERIGRIAWSPDGRLLAWPSTNHGGVQVVDWPARTSAARW